MPGYKTHQLGGVGFVFAVFLINSSIHFITLSIGFTELVIVALVTLFYSILPDVDIASSKSRSLVLGGGLLGIIYCFLTSWAILGIVIAVLLLLMIFLLHHRGRTHTPLGGVIFSIPLIYLHWVYFLIALVAYISHLILDGKLKWR